MKNIIIDNTQNLSLSMLREMIAEDIQLELSASAKTAILKAADFIEAAIKDNKTIYGVNTGFGQLAEVKISPDQLQQLQGNIVLSHAAGTGPLLEEKIVKLILLLKIKSLAQGYSGIRLDTIDLLIALFNHKIYPHIPAKGSVGASGDLAPLAHMALALIGEGNVSQEGKTTTARSALEKINLQAITLQPKEGLALLNGTQVSTSLALTALFQLENIFHCALLAGSLSLVAAGGNPASFNEPIQQIRNQKGQIHVSALYRKLLENCQYTIAKHRIQSPYSLRCQPQVMGACWDQMQHAADILEREVNGVSDNPVIFSDANKIISGGNFHAEPIAFAADNLALVFAEIGSLSERRVALLIDEHLSGLPAFLVPDPGLNSGFMLAQVTAASLVSENKSLAHPASVDSIPTSANQEDHVSMATFAARRLLEMADNTTTIVAIELLAACQGIDLAKPKKLNNILKLTHERIRKEVPFYKVDRFFAPDIEKVKQLIITQQLNLG